MSLTSYAPRHPRSRSPLPHVHPNSLDDARFVLRCVTSTSKRRRYGLGSPASVAALRQVAAKFFRLSA